MGCWRLFALVAVFIVLPSALAGPQNGQQGDALPAGGQGNGNAINGVTGVVLPETRNLTYEQSKHLFLQLLKNPKPFSMVSRTEWGATPPDTANMEPMKREDVDGVVIHHTVNPEDPVGCKKGQPDRWNRIRNIQAGHTKDLKYADIGYHYLIAKGCDGHWRIIEGRSTEYKGAHAGFMNVKDPASGKFVKKNMNDGKIGIAFSANFEDSDPAHPAKTRGGPPAEALEQLAILMNELKRKYPNIDVFGHGGSTAALTKGHTACPGDQMKAPLGAMREVFATVDRSKRMREGVKSI
jgi:hypothetical protein